MADLVEEKQHARLSPSASKRWMTCPGSVKFIESLGIENKPSKYAAEGTVAHEVHELCLVKNQQAKEYFGRTIEADGMKFKVNQNMIEAVQESLDYIHDRIEMAELDGLRVEVQVEVRSSLEYLGIPGLDGGTSDVVLLFWNEDDILVALEIFDYKHGAGVAVDPLENPQAMSYGLGIITKYKAAEELPIRITISQPRAHHPDGAIRCWDTNVKDVYEWEENKLIPCANATLEDDAPLVPSDDGCRFCDAAGQCPKLFERTQEVAMLDFDTLEDEVMLPDVTTLTAEQKTFIMDHADVLRSFIVAVEKQVKDEVNSGSQEYSSKYKLVRKTTRRKFTEDALDELTSPLLDHLDEDDLYERKSRSMTEIEKRLKKAIGVKDAKLIMDEVTTKPEGELVIAPQSDKRKAVQPSVIGDFTNLDD